MKGFARARLFCGCDVAFREGTDGRPVTVIEQKAASCPLTHHVRDLPLYDYREAQRPATRALPREEADYEEEG
jgi:hypothetical protein